jgi:hypothetical protein
MFEVENVTVVTFKKILKKEVKLKKEKEANAKIVQKYKNVGHKKKKKNIQKKNLKIQKHYNKIKKEKTKECEEKY